MEEIRENDFYFNILSYIDTFVEEEPVDLEVMQAGWKESDEEIEEIYRELE